ncbi:mismatch-specific DNA-glycosylase [Nakamurella endophytica]|uniref:mismatch-specific DNA-glycosylase n=1 Tax=Nakamurella endophytica TaxID=1748367 RepID=UPI001663A6F3
MRRGWTRAELETFRDLPVDDLIGSDCALLFVGINPGLWTAATGTHFAHPGNRFYPALFRAGLIDWAVSAGGGLTDRDREMLLRRRLGFTNLVNRATARADELDAAELLAGADRLRDTATRVRPAVVAVAGITAYRAAFGRRTARAGRQPDDLAGARLWVVPNPSGLNAHDTVDTLAAAYRDAGVAAGLVPPD